MLNLEKEQRNTGSTSPKIRKYKKEPVRAEEHNNRNDKRGNQQQKLVSLYEFTPRRWRRHGEAITQNKNDKGEITIEKVAI